MLGCRNRPTVDLAAAPSPRMAPDHLLRPAAAPDTLNEETADGRLLKLIRHSLTAGVL
jgi:hypothetical protein